MGRCFNGTMSKETESFLHIEKFAKGAAKDLRDIANGAILKIDLNANEKTVIQNAADVIDKICSRTIKSIKNPNDLFYNEINVEKLDIAYRSLKEANNNLYNLTNDEQNNATRMGTFMEYILMVNDLINEVESHQNRFQK